MKYSYYDQIFKECNELCDNAGKLVDSRNANFDMDDNDFIMLRRLFERLIYFPDIVNICLDFSYLISVMESEKDRFEVQKKQQYHINNFQREIESFIECGRSWKFEDYRCVDWERRLVEFMLNVRETFFE